MRALRLLKGRPWGIAGAVILLAVILVAALAPVIAPYHFNHIDLNHRMEPPSGNFVLGTDNLGRDVFSRFLYGSRPYVETGLIATGTAIVLGLFLGFLSASIRGKTDSILRMAIFISSLLVVALVTVTILQFFLVRVFAFRPLPTIMASLGNPELVTLITGTLLSFVFLPSVYATARRAFSVRALRQGLASLLPLTLVNLGIAVGAAVLIIVPVSYYGFGVPPPVPEWGNMLSSSGLHFSISAPWMSTPLIIAIAVACLGLVLFGLALREIWFPRLPEPLTGIKQSESAS